MIKLDKVILINWELLVNNRLKNANMVKFSIL